MKKVAIIGAGSLGHFFAKRLKESGYSIDLVVSRTMKSASKLAGPYEAKAFTVESLPSLEDYSVLVLAVPDDSIADLAFKVSTYWKPKGSAIVFHCSGLKTRSLLLPLASKYSKVCAIHPLRSIVIGQEIAFEEDLNCGVELDPADKFEISAFLEEVNLSPIWLNENNKAQYHLAASMLSNFTVSIQFAIAEICEDMREKGSNIELSHFGDLLRGTLENVNSKGPKDALTGPILRGDIGTVEAHLQILDENYPNLQTVYKQLAKLTLALALKRNSISDDVGEKLNALLEN